MLAGADTYEGKILLQKLWKQKLDWDETILAYLHTEWIQFIDTLRDLSRIKLPRYVCKSQYNQLQIHGFADASSDAYGCYIYVCTRYEDKVETVLLTAKSRVAPLATKTIPRLELCAAHLLSTVWKQIAPVLSKFKIDSVNFWSDSQVTLFWFEREPASLSTFVANRVTETLKVQAS